MTDIVKNLDEAINYINSKTSLRPKIGITLGSGLASFADLLDVDVALPFSEIPHFSPSKVEGHPGKLVIGHLHGTPLAVYQGRIHYYEGHSMQQVVFPTRVLGHWGVKTQIITNAAGGIDPNMQPGHLMIIKDQINLTGDNPLRGLNVDELGPRFPDMTDPFSPAHIEALDSIMNELKIAHSIGVYCGVQGPTYETAAEVRYLQIIGGQAVGMSTVPEVIAARHMDMDVVGISCITNLATGISDEKISHNDVTIVAKRVEKEFVEALIQFIGKLG